MGAIRPSRQDAGFSLLVDDRRAGRLGLQEQREQEDLGNGHVLGAFERRPAAGTGAGCRKIFREAMQGIQEGLPAAPQRIQDLSLVACIHNS